VINQVGIPKKPEIPAGDFAKALETVPLAIIPFDAQLFGAASNNGQMIAEQQKTGKIAESFRDIARKITGRAESKRKAEGSSLPLVGMITSRLQAMRK
jgi:pilus assembly protein CpaE